MGVNKLLPVHAHRVVGGATTSDAAWGVEEVVAAVEGVVVGAGSVGWGAGDWLVVGEGGFEDAFAAGEAGELQFELVDGGCGDDAFEG